MFFIFFQGNQHTQIIFKCLIKIMIIIFFSALLSNAFAESQLMPNHIPKGMQLFLVDVDLNHTKMEGITAVLENRNRHLFLSQETLIKWHLLLPDKPDFYLEKKAYYDLNDLYNIRYNFSEADLHLSMQLPAKDFKKRQFNKEKKSNTIIRPKNPGFYVNYDLSLLNDQLNKQKNAAASTDFVYFNHDGVGHSSFLLQTLSKENHDVYMDTASKNSLVRLESNWILDQPETMTSWRFGDGITSTSVWSGAVRFAGVQYATNFNTQPNFVTFPLPAFSGEAVVPTTINFFLDNQLQQSNTVNAGPFDISGIPVVTGAGNLVVKTKDLLNRETSVILPYYTSPMLLKKGLSQYSYEIGAVRENYGLVSNDYGNPLGVISYALGLSNTDTAAFHTEIMPDQQTIGGENNQQIGNFGILSLASAISHGKNGEGILGQIGFQRQATYLNFGGQLISTTHDFTQLGIGEDAFSPSLTGQAYVGYFLPHFGNFNFSYTQRNARTEENLGIGTVTYNKALPYHTFLMLSAVKTFMGARNNQFYLSFAWSPAPSYTASATLGNQLGNNQNNVVFSKNLPAGNGYGYRLTASPNNAQKGEIDFNANTDHGTYGSMISQVEHSTNVQLDAAGSLVHFAKENFLARPVNDSFIVVNIPGFENVRVYSSNQLIGKTNQAGELFIPHTLPYQENIIQFKAEDLPVNTQLKNNSMVIYPYYHSGALAKFNPQKVILLSFRLQNKKQQDLPVGTSLNLIKPARKLLVGYDGIVYLEMTDTALSEISGEAILSEKQTCKFSKQITPVHKKMVLDLGILLCQ